MVKSLYPNDIYQSRDEMDTGKIPRKQVEMGDTLGEGRFAVVRKASITEGTERQAVAVKALRSMQLPA